MQQLANIELFQSLSYRPSVSSLSVFNSDGSYVFADIGDGHYRVINNVLNDEQPIVTPSVAPSQDAQPDVIPSVAELQGEQPSVSSVADDDYVLEEWTDYPEEGDVVDPDAADCLAEHAMQVAISDAAKRLAKIKRASVHPWRRLFKGVLPAAVTGGWLAGKITGDPVAMGLATGVPLMGWGIKNGILPWIQEIQDRNLYKDYITQGIAQKVFTMENIGVLGDYLEEFDKKYGRYPDDAEMERIVRRARRA